MFERPRPNLAETGPLRRRNQFNSGSDLLDFGRTRPVAVEARIGSKPRKNWSNPLQPKYLRIGSKSGRQHCICPSPRQEPDQNNSTSGRVGDIRTVVGLSFPEVSGLDARGAKDVRAEHLSLRSIRRDLCFCCPGPCEHVKYHANTRTQRFLNKSATPRVSHSPLAGRRQWLVRC